MPKFNLEWFSFHYGQDIKPLSFELQGKSWFSKIEFDSYGYEKISGISFKEDYLLTGTF
jgi:hypothetical protein